MATIIKNIGVLTIFVVERIDSSNASDFDDDVFEILNIADIEALFDVKR